MRILIAHESIGTTGGVETYLGAILPELQTRGHRIAAVYHRRRDRANAGTWAGCADFVAGVEDTSEASVLRAVRDWRPDVCFSHNMQPLAVERALLAEWPVVKMMHGYFGTCASGLKMHAFPSARACDRALGAACLAMYVTRHCGQLHPRSLVSGYRWAQSQRRLFSQYRSIAVASAHMGAEVARHGVPQSQIEVLPLFPTLEAVAQHADGGSVLFAGRMTSLKGGDLLVDAVARASQRLGRTIPLLMAGDGPQRAAWAAQATSLGVDAEFTGWLDRDRLAAVFQRASVVVIPSVWPEPFGLVGLEAGAMGLPAIAFDVGGIREWLRPGENGVIVPPDRGSDGLADAIAAMFSQAAERSRMSLGARAVAKEMSRSVHADRLERVLEMAASESTAR
jgi:glycosyltransferase involved in cell wall biosynthesis